MLLISLSMLVPCPLCGEVHPVHIHAYIKRKVRSNWDYANVSLIIFQIICLTAKSRGTQYTKRILAPFLIPFCTIDGENVMTYLKRFPGERINYVQASIILGATDDRTIRRHLQRGRLLCEQTTLALCALLAELPSYGNVPERKGDESEVEFLIKTIAEVNRMCQRVAGAAMEALPEWVFVHGQELCAGLKKSAPIPLSSVVRILLFSDTS